MKLNHLNLTVTHPEETSAFLARHFDLRPGGGNAGMQLLHDDNGMVITLFKAGRRDLGGEAGEGEPAAPRTVRYPSTFHIGFIQESRERVDAINRRLRDEGIEAPAPSVQHGAYTFYFTAPGGFTIEVMG